MSLNIYFAHPTEPGEYAYEANYTHNAIPMAERAGLYDVIWRPEENGITHAGQLIEPLLAGIMDMLRHPDVYQELEPDNGWGNFDTFLSWLIALLKAARQYPQAAVRACR